MTWFKCFCTHVQGKHKKTLYVLPLLQSFLACLLIKKKKNYDLRSLFTFLTLSEFALETKNFQNLHITFHINNRSQNCFGLLRNNLYFTDTVFTHLLLNCIIKRIPLLVENQAVPRCSALCQTVMLM